MTNEGAAVVDDELTVRRAWRAEAEALVALILAVGAAFRELRIAAVSDNELSSAADTRGGRKAWDAADQPVGCEVVDGNARAEQVSVQPSHAGRRLVDHIERWSRE